MVPLSEQFSIPAPPDEIWPLLRDPSLVASCVPGATLVAGSRDGLYEGSIRIKFGPTVAVFRGEVTLGYDDAARRCTIEGRGVDQRGASRVLISSVVTATGADTTDVKMDGHYNVTGPLEAFAQAGGVHVARALMGEFAANIERIVRERRAPATDAAPAPVAAAAPAQPRAASGASLLWAALRSWLESIYSRKGKA
jgi:carbon monoxide dehydrogenase subunit G